MSVLFNTNQPATMPQLDQLYMGDPNVTPDQVDSNMFLAGSQGQQYVHQQAQNLGIGDPVAYYNKMRLAQQMAKTPSGAVMNAQRAVGQYDPNSLPGQLAHRDAMWNQVAAVNTQDQASLASLQQANNDHYYPLPAAGAPMPSLSPVAQTAMAQQGITNPLQFIMQQRLGTNAKLVDTKALAGASQSISADDLYNEPTFQSALAKNPQGSAQVFHALTGQPFAEYSANYAAAKDSERKRGIAAMAEHLDKQHAVIGKDGNVQWSEMSFDPTSGQVKPTGKFLSANPYQKSLEKYIPQVDSTLGRYTSLAAKGPPASLSNLATLQNQMPSLAEGMQTDNGPSQGVAADAMRGMLTSVGDLFSGNMSDPNYGGTVAARAFNAPTGSAIQHAAPLLRHNPQFQALMRSNPEKARQLILAIQMQGQKGLMQPQIPAINPDPNSYPFGE